MALSLNSTAQWTVSLYFWESCSKKGWTVRMMMFCTLTVLEKLKSFRLKAYF